MVREFHEWRYAVQKFLFIGIGGSGGKTLRFLHRELRRRLRVVGWDGPLPRSIAFLHIDLPEKWDGGGDEVPSVPELNEGCYLNLGEQPTDYRSYDYRVSIDPTRREGLVGWRPWPPEKVGLPFLGAGQVRAVGRMMGLARLSAIGDRVSRAAAQVSDDGALQDLASLQDTVRRFAGDFGEPLTTGKVFVVGSLGGGSGSGLFLDVVEVLSGTASAGGGGRAWLGDPVGVLYSPDLFENEAESMRLGTNPNALAAISELLNAYSAETLGNVESELLAPAGNVNQAAGRRCGKVNYLIGLQNDKIFLRSDIDVYQSVGRALAAFALDPQIQADWDSYIATNSVPRPFLVPMLDTGSPTLSFGYGTVTLGRHLFEEYAAERLARRAVDRLLNGHREGQPEGRSDDVIIADIVRAQRERFFEATGLYEYTAEHNQVLNALRDLDAKAVRLDGVERRVLKKIREEAQQLAPEKAREVFDQRFDDEAEAFEAEERTIQLHTFAAWTDRIVDEVLATTVECASDFGLRVTVRLLDELIAQVGDAARELERQRVELQEKENGFLARAADAFRRLGKLIMSGHEAYEKAASARRNALSARTEQELYQLTSEVLDDLNRRLLPQLKAALDGFLRRLRVGEDAAKRWTSGPVPQRLRPAPNEVLLDPVSEFSSRLESILCTNLGIAFTNDAVDRAAEEIVTGAWPSRENPTAPSQALVTIQSLWRPELVGGRLSSAGAGAAAFELTLDVAGLLPRAQRWVRDREGLISTYVRESLKDYLGPGVEQADRQQRFVNCLTLALQAARPLIDVAPKVETLLHPPADGRLVATISKIPMDSDHPGRAAVERVLVAQMGIPPNQLDRYFDPVTPTASVEAMVFINRSFHPAVVSSVMGPIVSQWEKSRGSETQFWHWRRARTLPRFVPLPPQSIDAVIAGYYVAGILGYLPPRGTTSWSEDPSQVLSAKGKWLPFPDRLLGPPVTRGAHVLPAILESFPLALLDLSKGSMRLLEPYQRLVELGQEPFTDLVKWLRTGHVQPGGKQPRVDGATFDARQTSLSNELAKLTKQLENIRLEPLEQVPGSLDRRRETATDAITQLSALTAFVSGVAETIEDDGEY